MRVAIRAARFRPNHPVSFVSFLNNRRRIQRFVEAGPAASGIKLRLRTKQWRSAAHAVVRARIFRVPVFAGEGTLCAGFARHMILFSGQLLFPLSVTFLNLLNLSLNFLAHKEISLSFL